MKYSKILLCMTVLVCLAFQACAVSESPNNISSNIAMGSNGSNIAMGSNGSNIAMESSGSNKTRLSREDYLNPNTISSGYYPIFPWYSTGGSFYNQGVSDITFSPFREYYTTSGMPVVGGIISTPTRLDITQRMPSRIYYGTGQALAYNQYVSTMPSGTNNLWIQGATNWTQYVVSPVGTWLKLVANAPVGGPAGFYDIVQTGTTSSKYKTYQFNQGYNTMDFNADQVGRHMLYFVVNNQPSNVIVVDVFAQAPAGNAAVSIYKPAIGMPENILGNSNGLTTTTSSNGQTTITSNGQTTITPFGQTTTTSDGTYQTTTSADGTTQTTTSTPSGTIVTSNNGQITTTSSG
jgi:hypothetical protein